MWATASERGTRQDEQKGARGRPFCCQGDGSGHRPDRIAGFLDGLAQRLRVGAAVDANGLGRHIRADARDGVDGEHGTRDGADAVVARHAFYLELDHAGTLLNGMETRHRAATDAV
ncbi:hypothetical protein CBM2634_A10007 [Cupriavidus taiwanensis]|uniref:Uncharacterized protein n=1 Tax=Cupriavidus taiwanensis TaxID=164546 RepID=A0A375IT88_9BURK|nr:hypothetical protein CBM2634_A10007 [Cupriavidus taiwanensis]